MNAVSFALFLKIYSFFISLSMVIGGDLASGGNVFFWSENFIRGSTPVSWALSTIIALLHFSQPPKL